MDVRHVADAVLYMAGLPPEANVLTMTVMAPRAAHAQLHVRQFGVRGSRQTQFVGGSRAANTAGEVDGIARNQNAVGQHGTHMDAHTHVKPVIRGTAIIIHCNCT
mgnify:CR=1 FL=1